MTNKELLKIIMKDLMDIYLPSPSFMEQMAVNELNKRVERLTEIEASITVELLRRRLTRQI